MVGVFSQFLPFQLECVVLFSDVEWLLGALPAPPSPLSSLCLHLPNPVTCPVRCSRMPAFTAQRLPGGKGLSCRLPSLHLAGCRSRGPFLAGTGTCTVPGGTERSSHSRAGSLSRIALAAFCMNHVECWVTACLPHVQSMFS